MTHIYTRIDRMGNIAYFCGHQCAGESGWDDLTIIEDPLAMVNEPPCALCSRTIHPDHYETKVTMKRQETVQMTTVTYRENNSGGYTIMDSEDFANLARAGWRVTEATDYRGRNASTCEIDVPDTAHSLGIARSLWERAVGRLVEDDPACECCGPRHEFMEW